MPWLQLKARAPQESADALERRMVELGALSVTLQDAEDEAVFQLDRHSTPLWSQVQLIGLFPGDADPEALRHDLGATGNDPALKIEYEILEERDWQRAWMSDFAPMRFGERLWVCPSWSQPPEPDAVNLMLDPGLAFGSGTHPTTALCLEWLDSHPPRDQRVIDYGCGSGILAIAAALLGARGITAIDNDPQAVTASADNRDLNGIDPRRLSVYPADADEPAPAELVLANILAGPLESLAPLLGRLTAPGGIVLLSGILSAQSESLSRTYAANGFAMQPPVLRDGWALLEGRRHDD